MKSTHRRILRDILSAPVAPFREEAMVEVLATWARRRDLPMECDPHGNVTIRYARGSGHAAKWTFLAHMDHPGFVVRRQKGRAVWAQFRGGVRREYFAGEKVRLFAPEGERTAEITSARRDRSSGFLDVRMVLTCATDVPAGTIGMWDKPVCRIRKDSITSRALDDLAGVAAVVCAVDDLASSRAEADVVLLLTRAEVAGFIGTLAACDSGSVPEGRSIVGLETSKAQPGAKIGDGTVIRIGDRTWTFAPELTAHIAAVAAELERKDRTFRHVRCLMPGGTCESTPLCVWGYPAAALCLPLGNYHNMSDRGHRIAPERVSVSDFRCLVKLLAALATSPHAPGSARQRLRERLEGLLERRKKYFQDPVPR
ncbi:MAG: hypothetical protein ACLFV7_08245 [Phycisphaerae bacterium]